MHVTKKQINKIIFQSCKLVALDFLIFVFLEFKLCARMYISLMKVASHVNYFYSVHITLFQSESSFKTARYQFEPNHKTVCKEDSPNPNKKPETFKGLWKAHQYKQKTNSNHKAPLESNYWSLYLLQTLVMARPFWVDWSASQTWPALKFINKHFMQMKELLKT